MRVLLIGCCLLGLTASCGGGKKRPDPFEALTRQIDSVGRQVDSLAVADEADGVTEAPIPAQADESFADFFYNFASDAAFQRTRIVFPISYYKGDQVMRTTQEDWQYDPLFSKYPAYTVLFDHEEDMEVEKDTSVHSVQIDWLYLSDRQVKRYYFERINQMWFLEAINKEQLSAEADGKEDFLAFYDRFSTDTVFQQQRLHQPLSFVTADPEDEFQILETTLDAEQWFAFRPPMMGGLLTNVHYGQPETMLSERKIVEFKGFGNGFSNTLYFERRHGLWRLVKFEDLSD